MISIVIPVYNKEKFIAETINSVLKQSFQEFELILINDGSTDNSLNLIKEFKDDRLKVLSISNSGVSTARNIGIKEAKYKYIAFLDADDWWGDTFLEEIFKLIKKYPHNKIFATGRCRVFKDNIELYQNNFLPNKNEIGLVDYIKVFSKNLPPINSSNVVVEKKELIKSGLFNIKQKQHEDHDLWLRLCTSNLIVFVNKNLSFYRKDLVNSASNNNYKAADFLLYLNTINQVKKSISQERRMFFKKYYNKFISLTFLKNKKYYSNQEKKIVSSKIYEILNFPLYIFLTLVSVLPVDSLINFYKNIKSND